MQPKMRHTGERPVDPLVLTIFPGPAGNTRVYEDEGNTLGYRTDAFAWTPVSHALGADGATRVRIGPVEGRYPGMLEARAHELRFPGRLPPRRVGHGAAEVPFATRTAECEAPCWTVEGDTLTTVIRLPRSRLTKREEVVIDWSVPPGSARALPGSPGDASGRGPDGFAGRLRRLRRAYDTLNRSWPKDWSPDSLVDAMQTGRRIELRPESAAAEIARLIERWPAVVADVGKMDIDAALRTRALAQLGAAAAR
jgi:alpha-glucosidase